MCCNGSFLLVLVVCKRWLGASELSVAGPRLVHVDSDKLIVLKDILIHETSTLSSPNDLRPNHGDQEVVEVLTEKSNVHGTWSPMPTAFVSVQTPIIGPA